MPYFARPNQLLTEHLEHVATQAARFCEAFGSGPCGALAGALHDLGKYQDAFQRRLAGARVAVEHSGLGAAHLLVQLPREDAAWPIAFAIAGHHTGLANAVAADPGDPTPLRDRLRDNAAPLESLPPALLPKVATPPSPQFLQRRQGESRHALAEAKRSWEFWTRFLFSALVDADRLDSESVETPDRAETRGRFAAIPALRSSLDGYLAAKIAALDESSRGTDVQKARAEILHACRAAASEAPGVFSLTAPTGGGKTLSAMTFALSHAERHSLRRVIVVIPYTSIIEQNAEVYGAALGAGNVVEHHSNLDPEKRKAALGEDCASRHDLATENWDAPVIVTTTVQFFESLFANQPSRCRKLHNVARSVIVLDEVQSLPLGLLTPILDGLRELAEHYGCTVVLSTATPPALTERPSLLGGLRGVRPILADPQRIAHGLKRVRYEWPRADGESRSWEDLAGELAGLPQVLCIVHRRDDARTLASLLLDKVEDRASVFHLSALMCAAHRTDTIARVGEALAAGRPCRLVATQLVEAGVDLDFPVVFRALGGLDSMVQAAGRCNREGRLAEPGRVVVFRAPTSPPPGTPRKAFEVTESLLRVFPEGPNVTDPAIMERFFRELQTVESLDVHGISALREECNFATVARKFQMIEDGFTSTIAVPYGAGGEQIALIEREGPSRERLRVLQRHTVNVYAKAFAALDGAGAIREVCEGLFALTTPFAHLYDSVRFGLAVGDEHPPAPDARRLIA